MTRKTAIFLTCAALALGCGRSQTARRTDQNYQVVQEGQASGVTSTINAPGETPPPMTNTAVDTTTNFTLPDNPAPLGTQPYPPAYPPTTVPQPRVQRPKPQPQEQPPPTETTVTEAPPPTETTATQAPPPTDTTKTDTTKTDTAPPPPPPV